MTGPIVAFVMALIMVYLASILVEWAIIARLVDTPAVGITISTVFGALLLLALRAGFAPEGLSSADVTRTAVAGGMIAAGRVALRWRSDRSAPDGGVDGRFG